MQRSALYARLEELIELNSCFSVHLTMNQGSQGQYQSLCQYLWKQHLQLWMRRLHGKLYYFAMMIKSLSWFPMLLLMPYQCQTFDLSLCLFLRLLQTLHQFLIIQQTLCQFPWLHFLWLLRLVHCHLHNEKEAWDIATANSQQSTQKRIILQYHVIIIHINYSNHSYILLIFVERKALLVQIYIFLHLLK